MADRRDQGVNPRVWSCGHTVGTGVMMLAALLVLLPFLIGHCPGGFVTPRSLPPQATPSTRPTSQPTTRPEPETLVRKDTRGRLTWPRPRFVERQAERERMVAAQIASGDSFRPAVRDKRVLAALRAVPRHAFVPSAWQAAAYDDTPLPIGHGQTISQPYIVALMTELLELSPGDRVLEVGTGSGYQAAVLSELTPYVFTIEIVEPLYREATERLRRLGYVTVRTRLGDGYAGWPEEAPFDAIIVTCAADDVPAPLWNQLKAGGRMVIPVGLADAIQSLVLLTKDQNGNRRTRKVLPVRFVPMLPGPDRKP